MVNSLLPQAPALPLLAPAVVLIVVAGELPLLFFSASTASELDSLNSLSSTSASLFSSACSGAGVESKSMSGWASPDSKSLVNLRPHKLFLIQYSYR